MVSERTQWLLQRIGELDEPGSLLHRACAATLPLLEVDAAAVSLLARDTSDGGVVAESGTGSRAIIDLQLDLGEGPDLEAFRGQVDVHVPDLHVADARWPVFREVAGETGARAIFALWLGLGAIELGVLHLQRERPGPLVGPQADDARVLAHMCSTLVVDVGVVADGDAPPATDLAEALLMPDRAVVHQAAGMVSVQIDGDLETALARLRGSAFAHNRPLHDVARDVVERRLRFEA